MKRTLLLIALLLTPAICFAQTTVNLSVTDTPDNQTWNNGTWAVNLQMQPGFTNPSGVFTVSSSGGSTAAQSGSLSATGTASFSLPANANIVPGQSTWVFKVCPQATSQCVTSSVLVTTSSPQAVALTPASIRINLTTAQPPVSAYATGEIAQAIIGSQFFLLGTGQQFCSAVSGNTCTTWAGGGVGAFSGTSFIDPRTAPYNVVQDGIAVFDAVLSNTSPIVTSATAHFLTNAKVGQLVFPTCCGGGGAAHIGSLVLLAAPATTTTILSIDSDTQIHLSQNASANQSNATLVFGTDNTAGMDAVSTAALSTKPQCIPVVVSGGLILTRHGFMNTGTCTLPITGAGDAQAAIFGWNKYGPTIVPVNSFDFTTCNGITAGGAGAGCFFSIQGITIHDVQIWGGENSLSGGNHVKSIWAAGNDSQAIDFNIVGWGASDTSLVGMTGGTGKQLDSNVTIDGGGSLNLLSIQEGCVACFFGDSAGQLVNAGAATALVYVPSGGVLGGVGTAYGVGANNTTMVYVAGKYQGIQDHWLAPASNHNDGLFVDSGGIAFLNQVTINEVGNTTDNGAFAKATGIIYASQSQFSGGSAGNALACSSCTTGAVHDDGSNTLGPSNAGVITSLQPTCPTVTGATATCATTAGSSNEKGTLRITVTAAGTASGTVTMNFVGTYKGLGLGSATPSCRFNPANTGTGTWNARAEMILSTRSATAPVINWDNNAAALGNLTWDIDYAC